MCLHLSGELTLEERNLSNIGGKPKKTSVVHVGTARYKRLADDSISISYHCRQQITAAQFMKYVIDNYAETAKQQLLKELSEFKE